MLRILLLLLVLPAQSEEGVYVGVGYGGRRLVSRDGLTWEISAEWAVEQAIAGLRQAMGMDIHDTGPELVRALPNIAETADLEEGIAGILQELTPRAGERASGGAASPLRAWR